jgi:hypothetical protein
MDADDCNPELILLSHMDATICDICRDRITNDISCVSCCHTLFHKKCIDENTKYGAVCPRCERNYNAVSAAPIIDRLLICTTTNDILNIYNAIYKTNPRHLRIVDHYLRKNMFSYSYHQHCIGYYNYQSIDPSIINIDDYKILWDQFTYGILRDYDWKFTFATGSSVAKMFRSTTPRDDEHIYLVLYNADYRLVRNQLKTLLKHIETKINTQILVHIEDGILVVYMPGVMRKFCIYIEYNADPYWFLYQHRKKFNSDGIMYDGNTLYLTIKTLVDYTTPSTFKTCSGLNYVMGNETPAQFINRIGHNLIIGSEDILNNVYRDYTLYITHGKHTDPLKKNLLHHIATSDLTDLININYCTTSNSNDISIKLVANGQEIPLSTTMISYITIRQLIVKELCTVPLGITT